MTVRSFFLLAFQESLMLLLETHHPTTHHIKCTHIGPTNMTWERDLSIMVDDVFDGYIKIIKNFRVLS